MSQPDSPLNYALQLDFVSLHRAIVGVSFFAIATVGLADSTADWQSYTEINHLVHEKHMRLRNVRREERGYTIEAADEKAS
jgi:hypothetical protein